ncbi:hypothetical protein Tco_1195811 [Tanacetum coccineum]
MSWKQGAVVYDVVPFGLYKLRHTRQSCNNNAAALTRVTEGEPSALRELRLESKNAGDKAVREYTDKQFLQPIPNTP